MGARRWSVEPVSALDDLGEVAMPRGINDMANVVSAEADVPEPASRRAGRKPQQLTLLDAPAAVAAPEALSDPRRWLREAARAWGEVHGREMTVRWARDVALIKPLLRQHGVEELAARWCTYVQTMDPYLARRGWDVPTFSACIDRFDGEVDCAQQVGLRNLHPIRDPVTGAVLGRRRGW